MRLISESDYIAHHGIKGQKWGVRRFQNEDGTRTPAGEKRYKKTVRDAKTLADRHASVEKMNRELTANVPKGAQILVSPETKVEFKKRIDAFVDSSTAFNKKYGEAISDIVTMDDGYDYVRSMIRDDRLGGYVEYLSVIGPTKKPKM